jgi:hypothetical protein
MCDNRLRLHHLQQLLNLHHRHRQHRQQLPRSQQVRQQQK